MSSLIGGLDETGYGSLAGPLVIVVAVFPFEKARPIGCQDSKRTSRSGREKIAPELLKDAAFVGFGWASASYINTHGVAEAWQTAANRALVGCPPLEDLVVDGNRQVLKYTNPQSVIAKADLTCWQVSAASIIAKLVRDQEMEELASYYPGYDFESNAGYGTKKHLDALAELGPSPIHRDKYIRKILNPSTKKKPSRFR